VAPYAFEGLRPRTWARMDIETMLLEAEFVRISGLRERSSGPPVMHELVFCEGRVLS